MTYIISEIASAHNGKADNLKKLIDASINSNADAVKIQIFKTENLLQKKHKNYKLFKKIEISQEKIFNILKRVSDKKIDLILEPYDFDSLKFIKKIKKFHSIKIPTSDTKNLKFIKEASKVKKKIFLGIAGLKLNEIKKIINMLKKNQLNLVHGFQSFPTKFLDTDGICIRAGHHCTQPIMNRLGINATALASFYINNTKNDIEKLGDSIKKTADIFK